MRELGYRVEGDGNVTVVGLSNPNAAVALESFGQVLEILSPTAVIEPPMFGILEPATGG